MVEIKKTFLGTSPLHIDFVEVLTTKEAKVTVNLPVALQIDGEPKSKTEHIQVRVMPNAFKFAVGKQRNE